MKLLIAFLLAPILLNANTARASTMPLDSIAVEFAYRKITNSSDDRLVQIQALRAKSEANLKEICGSTGALCQCQFFISSNDSSPISGIFSAFNEFSNTYSCKIPGTKVPSMYRYARLRSTKNYKSTGLIPIQTSLTLGEVLGDLNKSYVRKIYSYSCSRTFFEGEGVGSTSISCLNQNSTPPVPNGQKLGLIYSNYDFYLYQSQVSDNFSDKEGDIPFSTSICGYNAPPKISCAGSALTLKYGFYQDQSNPFIVSVALTAKPENNYISQYGFAALPDSAGNCPPGLEKIRPYIAQPHSMLPSHGNQTLPSNFVNVNGSLNNVVVELESTMANKTLNVIKLSNKIPCNPKDGDCSGVAFNFPTNAQTVNYTASTPVVCAIPPQLLNDL